MDSVELLLIHEPYKGSRRYVPALEEAHGDGGGKPIGISNFNATRYADFIRTCTVPPAVNQVEAHVFFQQTWMQAIMQEHDTGMQAWSPLAAVKNVFFC